MRVEGVIGGLQRTSEREDLSLYLSRTLPAVATQLGAVAQLHGGARSERDRRAASMLHRDRERFLRRFRLEGAERTAGAMWSAGPELVAFHDDSPGAALSRHAVRATDGGQLDSFRSILLLEYQQLLLNVLRSLVSDHADELVALTSSSIEDHALARTAMQLAARERWPEDAFWDAELGPATVFHQRLLATLRRVVLTTYENRAAELGIAFVPSPRALALPFRTRRFVPPETLEDVKIARVLSDGVETVFAFSELGEYLGLHDARALRTSLADAAQPVEWRLGANEIVALAVGEEVVVVLQGGTWSYRSDAQLRARIDFAEPALSTACAELWSIARRLSRARRGGILVIVDDVVGLVESGACRADLATIPTERRSDPGAPLDPGQESAALEGLLLDQLQGRSCAELGEALLFRMACVDGALVVDRAGTLLGFGVIFATCVPQAGREGAGENAALFASKFGTAIKVSADGPITGYRHGHRI